MTNNRFELDKERLATTDEHGHRIYMYPENVRGVWKDRRTYVNWVLIILYLVFPWIYINNKPAMLIDIVNREFTFLGATFYGVDPIFFFLIAISLLFFIAFITSLFGRVWCGWACPQTVFIQSLFLKIEEFVEGNARKRRALEEAPLSVDKIIKRIIKWTLFTVISLHIAHTFVGYFTGPRELFYITLHSPFSHPALFTATMIIATIFLLDFGWFREQFCIIACPYGRMQSVMMDENSSIIMYDQKRGEPRRGSAENEGDCINCYNCVKVCPTGIDIRRGTQLECIACTNCIDACDEIMLKLNRPSGLIRYGSENELKGEKRKIVTPRSILYVFVSILCVSTFLIFLKSSSNLELIFLRGEESYTQNTTEITNRFKLKIHHQGDHPYSATIKLNDESLNSKIKIITPVSPIDLKVHDKQVIVFFKFESDILKNGSKKIEVDLFDNLSQKNIATKEVILVGPTN